MSTEPFYFSEGWNSQYFKSGFLNQLASSGHLFLCSSTPALSPHQHGENRTEILKLKYFFSFF